MQGMLSSPEASLDQPSFKGMVCTRRNAYYSPILNGKLENATVVQLINSEGALLEHGIICSGMSCKCRQ